LHRRRKKPLDYPRSPIYLESGIWAEYIQSDWRATSRHAGGQLDFHNAPNGGSQMNLNDLHKNASAGDKTAETRLFGKLLARFRLIARQRIGDSSDVEEVVQEALVVVARKYRDLKIEVSFGAWAQRVIDLGIKDFYRKKGRQESRRDQYVELLGSSDLSEEDVNLKRRLLHCLKRLHRVNHRHARILNLAYLGFDMTEICQKLALTRNNSYSVLFRARQALKDCLENGTAKA
jgi:RNA polymerase sigma factor (sigma-70 family)